MLPQNTVPAAGPSTFAQKDFSTIDFCKNPHSLTSGGPAHMGVVLPLVTPLRGVFQFALPHGHTPPWGVTVWGCDWETSLADGLGV